MPDHAPLDHAPADPDPDPVAPTLPVPDRAPADSPADSATEPSPGFGRTI